MKLYRYLLAAAIYAIPASAFAQCSGIFTPGQICGNGTAAGKTASATSVSAAFNQAFCSTANSGLLNVAGSWVCLGTSGTGNFARVTAPTITGGTFTTVASLGLVNSGFNTFLNATGTNTANRNVNFNPNDADRTITMSGNINVGGGFLTGGVLTLPTVAQGDIWYGSASGVISGLAKSATATRYLANTGTTNNPNWDQVNLANGVTGLLPFSNLATVSADFVVGNFTGSAASPGSAAIGNCASALTYSTGTHSFGCNAGLGTGSVTAGGGGIVPTSGGPSTLFLEQANPGGRLTVVSGGCNVTTDQVAQTTLYYAPCAGKYVPTYDGTNMVMRAFTASDTDTVGLSISMASSANWTANTLYDGFVGLDSSTLRLCTGPAWSSSTAGSSSRGTGAGTTELQLFKGLWTNKNSMTCRYGAASTFTCAANQCTYVGTSLTGASAGTIDLKFGTAAASGGLGLLSICNMYNRTDTRAASSDTTASWSYTSSTWRAANAGNTKISLVSCIGDIVVSAKYADLVSPSGTSSFQNIAIGLNASNAVAARAITATAAGTSTAGWSLLSVMDDVVPTGLSTIFAIENADGTHATTFNGQSSPFNYMQLSLTASM